VSNALGAIGAAVRGIAATGEALLPGGVFWVAVAVVLVGVGWLILKR
jgi:hypothetical protein